MKRLVLLFTGNTYSADVPDEIVDDTRTFMNAVMREKRDGKTSLIQLGSESKDLPGDSQLDSSYLIGWYINESPPDRSKQLSEEFMREILKQAKAGDDWKGG